MKVETIETHLEEAGAVILQGPPGTGKSWTARQVVESQLRDGDATLATCQWARLVERYGSPEQALEAAVHRPVVWDMVHLQEAKSAEEGRAGPCAVNREVIYELAEVARAREEAGNGPTILIFDDLQRCDLATALGEVSVLLAPTRRSSRRAGARREGWAVGMRRSSGQGAAGGGSGERQAFTLPESLWFLGTLDTADVPGVAVDYSLHGRFRFVDMMPTSEPLAEYYAERGSEEIGKVAVEGFERMAEKLREVLPARMQVGHTYFMVEPGDGDLDRWCDRLAGRLAYQVVPLLRAYNLENLELTLTTFNKADSISLPLSQPSRNRQEAEKRKISGWLDSLADGLERPEQ